MIHTQLICHESRWYLRDSKACTVPSQCTLFRSICHRRNQYISSHTGFYRRALTVTIDRSSTSPESFIFWLLRVSFISLQHSKHVHILPSPLRVPYCTCRSIDSRNIFQDRGESDSWAIKYNAYFRNTNLWKNLFQTWNSCNLIVLRSLKYILSSIKCIVIEKFSENNNLFSEKADCKSNLYLRIFENLLKYKLKRNSCLVCQNDFNYIQSVYEINI